MTTDMSAVIVPKSDQINADDLIAGPRTYTIEAVRIEPGTEQPVNIKLSGEQRAWRPCKSMSRVMVAAWGPDAKVYPGRMVTLYRDPKVKWGGLEVGGIRIGAMSHIERELMIQLTATKGKRAPHIVKPLVADVQPIASKARQTAQEWADEHVSAVQETETLDDLSELIWKGSRAMAKLETEKPDLWAQINTAYSARRALLEGASGPENSDVGGDDDVSDWEG